MKRAELDAVRSGLSTGVCERGMLKVIMTSRYVTHPIHDVASESLSVRPLPHFVFPPYNRADVIIVSAAHYCAVCRQPGGAGAGLWTIHAAG